MIITTTDTIPNKEITDIIGIARGNAVRAKHLGKDFLTSLTKVLGGEMESYTNLLEETRKQSIERMVNNAKTKGADGVVNIRFTTSDIAKDTCEILVYGTAVKFKSKS